MKSNRLAGPNTDIAVAPLMAGRTLIASGGVLKIVVTERVPVAIWRQGETLTYFFKTGRKKAEGRMVGGLMQGEWRFWRETGELWQIGRFRGGVKHGDWLRFARDGALEKRETFANGKAATPARRSGQAPSVA